MVAEGSTKKRYFKLVAFVVIVRPIFSLSTDKLIFLTLFASNLFKGRKKFRKYL